MTNGQRRQLPANVAEVLMCSKHNGNRCVVVCDETGTPLRAYELVGQNYLRQDDPPTSDVFVDITGLTHTEAWQAIDDKVRQTLAERKLWEV